MLVGLMRRFPHRSHTPARQAVRPDLQVVGSEPGKWKLGVVCLCIPDKAETHLKVVYIALGHICMRS